MNHSTRAQAARLDRSLRPDGPPGLKVQSDPERAPVSFAWWARTTTDRGSKYFHVETVYRLDRQRIDDHTSRLVATSFHAMSMAEIRGYLAQRQSALLPKLPAGYSWIGPVLVEDVAGAERLVRAPCIKLSPQLELAGELASRVLAMRGRHAALEARPQ